MRLPMGSSDATGGRSTDGPMGGGARLLNQGGPERLSSGGSRALAWGENSPIQQPSAPDAGTGG